MIIEIKDLKPYGTAFINGYRLVFNPYFFTKGKDKGKIRCYYRKGSKFKSIILKPEDIVLLKKDEDKKEDIK